MADDNDALADIERQISKLESTATNLEMMSTLAARAGQQDNSLQLADSAVDVRVQQFKLYRAKDKLQENSNEWKALTASLEVVNHFIDESLADLGQIKNVLDSVSQLLAIATKLLTVVGA